MDGRSRATIVVFLLCFIAVTPTAGHTLDVCATCHTNATCENKSDGSGKVCNCKYGFVGNGRTFCQDKDECHIGVSKICGLHTACHNTYGSYYCTCLAGYSPSNNMPIFIPNDGTHCQDIDECSVAGLCGEGGQCRNLEGSFYCSCQLGYRVHNGSEPFNPHRDIASCKVVDCGQPASPEDTVLLSSTGTTYGSVAMFNCDEGFLWRRGDNTSVCGADGLWRGPTMVCEGIDCGSPPALHHSHMLWNKSTMMGTEVVYQCDSGYHNVGKGNVSVCTAAGQWEGASVLCQDIDECSIAGLCGEGGQCRNLEGSFHCSCQLGYRVHNGSEPFNPHRDIASCKVVDCGQPASPEDTVLLSSTGTTYGSVAMFNCDEGFLWRRGDNTSVCGADGLWRGPTMVCEEILCGRPPVIESTEQVWNKNSTPGSTVLYFCKEGFFKKGGSNVSICNENGQWTPPTLSCQEILCGDPPILPHTGQVWNGSSTPGSTVTYYCKIGFYQNDGNNISLCTINGYWTEPSISCKEVDCGAPPDISHSVLLWDQISKVGTQVVYQCNSGYRSVGGRNASVCTASGEWDEASLLCQEISCGPPLTLPHTNLLWDRTSRPGSVGLYECMDGFYQESGNGISTCLTSGKWAKVSVKCKAKCGPVPFLANSEVVWHNRSVVIHRCVDGYHSWRGSNVSLCSSSGMWQESTLKCIEIKPPVNRLFVSNEKCLHWRAEKYEENTEVYQVTYIGSRDYQRSFKDKRKQFLSSKSDQVEICLNLLPVTNYSISITAVSARFTATISTNTSLTVPPAPVVYYREFETRVPTLRLRRSPNTLDPISLYQVFVLPVETIMVFDCSSPVDQNPSSKSESSTEYVTAQIHVSHVGTEMNFTVGDGLYYGSFFNAPLNNGRNYYIILRAVSQWKRDLKSSCVLWAKVRGTSYVLKVSSLSATASIGLVALAVLGGYIYNWFPIRSSLLTSPERHRPVSYPTTSHPTRVCLQGDNRCAAAGPRITMAQNQVILQFRFATFGDSMLRKMNLLRHQKRFCDVTVHINQLEVPGHKVVFAAGSSFLRDQFILQQDSREVQISMIQEAEVGRQLLLSCYTGQLEFPELELVHYLTVASFLQMGHIVEQCTQALSKFIKPQASRQLEVDVEMRGENKEEGLSSQTSREQECSQAQTVHQEDEKEEEVEQIEDHNSSDYDDDDDDDDDDVIVQPKSPVQTLDRRPRQNVVESDITIVKVESVSEVAENSITGHFPTSPPAALHSPEPQHSLINSTVDSRSSEMVVQPGMAGYPLSPPPPSPPTEKHIGFQRNYDKPLQWYHQCPKCARVFRQLENYANHLKMHKLFMCLLCGKTFTQKGNLHRHMRVHAGIKPFQCKICGKTFTQKCSLLDHLNLHSGDKPHRCNYCDMVFAHKPVLRKHLKQIHGKNSFDNANEGNLHDGGLDFDFGRM